MKKTTTPFSFFLFVTFLFSFHFSFSQTIPSTKLTSGSYTFNLPYNSFTDPSTSTGVGGSASCVTGNISSFDYPDNLNIEETLQNLSGTCITITFQALSVLVCANDFLIIYDGPTTSSPVLATYTGMATAQTPSSLLTTSQYVTIRFISDASGHSKGWAINFSTGTCPTTPSNDDYTGAVPLSVGASCPNPTSGTTYGAHLSAQTVVCGSSGTAANDDVWYSFTANSSATTVTVVGSNSMNPVVQVLTSTLVNVACQDNTSGTNSTEVLNLTLTSGSTYYVRIYDANTGVGQNTTPYTFTICVVGASQSDCAGATIVNSYFTLSGQATGYALQEYSSSTFGCLVSGEHRSLWFKMHVTSPGTIAFTLTPGSSGTQDVDWAIWGPYASSSNCPVTGSPIRCTYAVQHPTNGLGDPTYVPAWGGVSNDNTESASGNGWLAWIPCTSGCSFTPADGSVTAGQWYIFLIDGFSDFNGGSMSLSWSGTATLPITLTDFYGQAYLDYNLLNWATQSEFNNNYWTIERSADGESFDPVATIDGYGNSTTTKTYKYFDRNPLKGNNYYRLKQTDYDGAFTYSNVVLLTNFGDEITVKNIYPNPVSDDLHVELYSNQNYDCSLKIINSIGRVVLNVDQAIQEGSNSLDLDMKNLEKGVYFLQLFNPNGGTIVTRKIVKI